MSEAKASECEQRSEKRVATRKKREAKRAFFRAKTKAIEESQILKSSKKTNFIKNRMNSCAAKFYFSFCEFYCFSANEFLLQRKKPFFSTKFFHETAKNTVKVNFCTLKHQ